MLCATLIKIAEADLDRILHRVQVDDQLVRIFSEFLCLRPPAAVLRWGGGGGTCPSLLVTHPPDSKASWKNFQAI